MSLRFHAVLLVIICLSLLTNGEHYNDLPPPFMRGTDVEWRFWCRTFVGPWSANADDALSTVGCTNSYYPTVFSCGMESTTNAIDGSFISNNKCHARNGDNKAPVRAIARCCHMYSEMDIVDVHSGFSGSHDDATATASCPSGYWLVGCTVDTMWTHIDGSYPIDGQKCVARKGGNDGHGVRARARCIKLLESDKKLECKNVQGPRSANTDGAISEVTCDDGWFMASCSGYSAWLSVDSWHVSYNKCIARNTQNLWAGRGVWAHGICCRRE